MNADIVMIPVDSTEIRNGLLWAINKYLLHEHGLALGVYEQIDGLALLAIDEPWEFTPEANVEEAEKFANWLKERSRLAV